MVCWFVDHTHATPLATVALTTPGEGAEEEKGSFCLQYFVQFVREGRNVLKSNYVCVQVKCPERVSSQIFAVVLRLSTDGPYHSCPGQTAESSISLMYRERERQRDC